jgi:hypothetical protein
MYPARDEASPLRVASGIQIHFSHDSMCRYFRRLLRYAYAPTPRSVGIRSSGKAMPASNSMPRARNRERRCR